jgi:hypothetical protein
MIFEAFSMLFFLLSVKNYITKEVLSERGVGEKVPERARNNGLQISQTPINRAKPTFDSLKKPISAFVGLPSRFRRRNASFQRMVPCLGAFSR